MPKLVQFYVEGKSDQTFLEGEKFREFLGLYGYVPKVKNLRTRGNVLSNFEKFLKLSASSKIIYANFLVYDKDCKEVNTRKLEDIIKLYKRTFHAVAIQELEAWFLADHDEVKKIYSKAKPEKDTQSITNPKAVLKTLFNKGGKGFKDEMGFAEHFAGKINFGEARKHNNSLDRFLRVFEGSDLK